LIKGEDSELICTSNILVKLIKYILTYFIVVDINK